MKFLPLFVSCFLIFCFEFYGQSESFDTYINPVIPGDHPDPTLTKIGNDFYTTGSSFNPTPKIYHSTDLVHWEVVAQPVKASWTVYGDEPGGGIWGGHMVYYNNSYWHYFARGGVGMYFVKADDPKGPWSEPTRVNTAPGLPPFGQDNSIFIDDDTGKWYMLTKAGQSNNHIVELGEDGQPTGVVLDLTWLNPAPDLPYGWAEGPVMWKYNGYYYYSFAQHLVGAQYVMRSDTLTDIDSAWTIVGTNIFTGQKFNYNTPNHISPAVLLDDSTSWVVAHSYYGSASWYAHGRQGLLCQVTYNAQGFPTIQYPSNEGVTAPNLPSGGVPWMVPKSDMFDNPVLHPNWSFLGFTPDNTYSLTDMEGWLYLEPYGETNTVIQNDGEHNYSLITRVYSEPESALDEAGLWIFNGPETLHAKVFITGSSEQKVVAFSFDNTAYDVEVDVDSIVWLKLVREEHMLSGFYSIDGNNWVQIGSSINAASIDIEQTQFNNFTGNQQGLYVRGKPAYFDLYIYRDAYTKITAQNPASKLGVSYSSTYLGDINNDEWAMYAGVEFGGDDYLKTPVSLEISASTPLDGGIAEVWLDSIDTGRKIAGCRIDSTGSWTNYKIFRANVDSVSGNHDVYLKFLGAGTQQLFRINWFRFLSEYDTLTSADDNLGIHQGINDYKLNQNYPNPFNPVTQIDYSVPRNSYITLKVYNLLGQEVTSLFEGFQKIGNYSATFDGSGLASGVYLYRMTAANFTDTKKIMLLK
ncbi:MAG: family 43 glycosylhydrolase [Ignavibacteria bacterium]